MNFQISRTTALILLGASLTINIFFYVGITKNGDFEKLVSESVSQRLLENEYSKVGGKDNYEILAKAQKIQVSQQITEIKSFVEASEKAGIPTGKQISAPQAPVTSPQSSSGKTLGTEAKKLELYVMGYCPFGEFAMKILPGLISKFKDDGVKFEVNYIARKTGDGYAPKDFESLHGVAEAEEDIRQLCVNKNYWVSKLAEYAVKRYENADNYGRVNEDPSIALKAVGIDAKKISSCISSGEGGKLLAENIKKAESKNVTGSPTWFANGTEKFGGFAMQVAVSQFCTANPGLKGCSGITIEPQTQAAGNAPKCAN